MTDVRTDKVSYRVASLLTKTLQADVLLTHSSSIKILGLESYDFFRNFFVLVFLPSYRNFKNRYSKS